jgi:hypothetical protein
MSLASLLRSGRQIGTVLLFGVVPAVLLGTVLALSAHDDFAFDLRQFWQGGRDVLHGHSPYPPVAALPSADVAAALDPHGIQEAFRFPYPPATAVAMVPFGALPFNVAGAVMTVLLVAAVAGALWLLDVRDWRCYGVAFGSFTTIGAIRLATLTPLLLLGVAAAWRYRDRRVIAGLLVGAVVVAKGFLWPLGVWLLATRRFAAAVVAGASAAVATALGVAVVGWDSVDRYRELVARLVDAVEEQGYSLVALAADAGAPSGAARALALAVGAAAIVGVVVAARRSEPGADVLALTFALVAALALSPIVWLHYFMLLLVPIALVSPQLSAVWFAPLVLWVTPYQETEGDTWRVVLAWAVVGVVGVAVARAARRPVASRATLGRHGLRTADT